MALPTVAPMPLSGEDSMVEAKCPRRQYFVRIVRSDNLAADYRPQGQGNLWLTEREWCDLILYSPPLPLRIQRDDNYIAELDEAVAEFVLDMDAAET